MRGRERGRERAERERESEMIEKERARQDWRRIIVFLYAISSLGG